MNQDLQISQQKLIFSRFNPAEGQVFRIYWNEGGEKDGTVLVGYGIKYKKEYAAKRFLMSAAYYVIDHDYGTTDYLGDFNGMRDELCKELGIPITVPKKTNTLKFEWLKADGSVDRTVGRVYDKYRGLKPWLLTSEEYRAHIAVV